MAYRDFRDNPADALQQSPFYAVPEQVGEFESFVRRLIAGGGGDEPESGLEALAVAFGSDWAGGPDRRHIVALLTDASAHPLGVGRGASTYPPGVPVTLDDLRAPLADATKRLLLFAPGTTPWNVIAADWDHVVHRPARVGGGLIEYEFTEIIDAIGSSI
ncbi:MAG: VWA domain-containing protein [Actinoplanes sp.]